jgi:putative membrane protein
MKHTPKDVFLKTIILAGFAFWLIHLLLSGNIDLYISPKLTWLSKLAALVFTVLALASIIPVGHGPAHTCCEHGHSHDTLNLTTIFIFCVPLLLGFAVKPQVLDSASLANSINTSGSLPFYVSQFSHPNKLNTSFPNKTATAPKSGNDNNLPASANKPSKPAGSPARETDLLQLALQDNPDQLYNQAYRLTGFVYKDSKLAGNQFVLTRFVVTCCIVDAQPIGIITELPGSADLKADTWLEAEGVLKKGNLKDSAQIEPVLNFNPEEENVPYFVVTKYKKIAAPKDPYLTISQ